MAWPFWQLYRQHITCSPQVPSKETIICVCHISSTAGRIESALDHLNVRVRKIHMFVCVYYIITIIYYIYICVCVYCTTINEVFAFSEVQAVHWPWQAIN